MPDFVVTVPVWDTEKQFPHTYYCVRDLCETEHPSMVAVMVDNGSPFSNVQEYLKKMVELFPQRLHVIFNTLNRGYAGGANQGLKWGYDNGAEYYIVCNNDIRFLKATWYKNLLSRLEAEPMSLVGLRLIPDNMWVYFDDTHHPYLEGYMLAFRRRFLEDVGYFDEIFHPAWVEDVELSWRAQRKGYKLVKEENVPILHAYGKTGYDGRLAFNNICESNVELFKEKMRGGKDDWVGPESI